MDEIECLVEVYRDPNFKKPSAASEETVEEEKPDETVAKSIESSAVEYDPSEKKLGGRAGSIRAIVTRCRMTSGLETGALHLVTIDGCTIGSAGRVAELTFITTACPINDSSETTTFEAIMSVLNVLKLLNTQF